MPIFKLIRAATRPLVLAAEKMFNPTPLQRSDEEQQRVDKETSAIVMYEYPACPFCMITRRAIRRLNLKIELRDAMNDPQHKQALIHGGGKDQVPCLRITTRDDVQWLYESGDIIEYLDKRFGAAATE